MKDSELCSCKFGHVLSKYDREELEDDLREKWLSPNGPSLRSLAEIFNKEVLRTSLESDGELLLDGEVDNIYRLLTDEDVSSGNYTRAVRRLSKRGVEVDTLTDDFISYQTINRHFKNCCEISKERSSSDPKSKIEKSKDRVLALIQRTERVSENELNRLKNSDGINIRDPRVFAEITVSCDECGAVLSITDVLEGQPCNCVL